MSINIDPQNEDPFYRYQMPKVSIKHEGKKFTIINNLDDISKSLNTQCDFLVKYLTTSLGSQMKKNKLNGQFTEERIQKQIFNFIEEFILCKSCRNPETNLSCQSKKILQSSCTACGKTNIISSKNKTINFILTKLKVSKN